MQTRILSLSPEQRAALFNATGMPLRRLGIDLTSGLAVPIDRHCLRCLLADDLPGVTVGPSGVCNQCLAFDAETALGYYEPQKLFDVVEAFKGNGAQNCVVAYSGGKDSALTLMLAVKELGLRPVAVLVDNGFIPNEVKDNAGEFCGKFAVELLVERINISSVARDALTSNTSKIPCSTCISGVFATMARICKQRSTQLVLSGHRFPPLTYPLSAFTKRAGDGQFMCASPLLARRLSEKDQMALIKAAGWKSVEIAGNTSNCKLIGVVEKRMYDLFGYNPHIHEVSKEIRAGFYGREDGFRKVDRPEISPAHHKWVEERLSNGPAAPTAEIPQPATAQPYARGVDA